jgi:hypothetical protein
MGKKGFFENQKSCADAGIEYKKYFLEILTNLTNHKMERHGTGGHPERHKLYDPLPGSVWQGPSW